MDIVAEHTFRRALGVPLLDPTPSEVEDAQSVDTGGGKRSPRFEHDLSDNLDAGADGNIKREQVDDTRMVTGPRSSTYSYTQAFTAMAGAMEDHDDLQVASEGHNGESHLCTKCILLTHGAMQRRMDLSYWWTSGRTDRNGGRDCDIALNYH